MRDARDETFTQTLRCGTKGGYEAMTKGKRK